MKPMKPDRSPPGLQSKVLPLCAPLLLGAAAPPATAPSPPPIGPIVPSGQNEAFNEAMRPINRAILACEDKAIGKYVDDLTTYLSDAAKDDIAARVIDDCDFLIVEQAGLYRKYLTPNVSRERSLMVTQAMEKALVRVAIGSRVERNARGSLRQSEAATDSPSASQKDD